MVKGLELFRERFRQFEGAFVLIGGAACHKWFAQQGADFRATKDLDIVLIVEVADPAFVAALRVFIAEGNYTIQEKSEGGHFLPLSDLQQPGHSVIIDRLSRFY